MIIQITQERPDTENAKTLIAGLDSYLAPLYPPNSQHGLSVEKLLSEAVAFFIIRNDRTAVGCGGVKCCGAEYGEIKRMFIRPEFRGKGYAIV